MSAPPGPPEPAALTFDEITRPRTTWPIREFPRLVIDAARLVDQAARRDLRITLGLSAVASVLMAAQLFAAQRVLRGLVEDEPTVGRLVGPVVILVVLFTAGSVAAAVAGERQRLLGELVSRHTQGLVADAAAGAELIAYESPSFHNRLQRTLVHLSGRPVQVTSAFAAMVGSITTMAGTTVALAAVAPFLVLLVVAAIVPLFVAVKVLGRLAFGFDLAQTEADRRRSYLVMLLVHKQGSKELRSFQLERELRGRLDALWAQRIARLRTLVRRRTIAGAAARAISGSIVGGVLLLLVWMVSTDRLTVPQAGVAAGAVVLLGRGLQNLTSSISTLYECALFLRDAQAFVQEAAVARAGSDPLGTPPAFGGIELVDVSFRYPTGQEPALDGVNLVIRPGEVIALVGENGSGKTTLAKVLAQLFEPSAGEVLWGGQAVTAEQRPALRSNIAVLFQDFERYLFSAADNIGFGRAEALADADRIRDAATRAGLAELLDGFRDGYETLLGPEFRGGTDLSGGQWQRLALARVFFRDAPLVILDEPTSALDPQAERDLFDRLRELWRGRAVVLISHRFSTVTSADRIVVMERGRVLEQGSHAELMERGGRYRELFTLQAAPYQGTWSP